MAHKRSSSSMSISTRYASDAPQALPSANLCSTCGQPAIPESTPPSYESSDVQAESYDEKTGEPTTPATPPTSPHSSDTLHCSVHPPPSEPRHLTCCTRLICSSCLAKNPRLATYCPFCQISTPIYNDQGAEKPPLIPDGLREPPSYEEPNERDAEKSSPPPPEEENGNPPPYSAAPDGGARRKADTQAQINEPPPQDVEHYVRKTDTLTSLSLAYHIPKTTLLRHNALFSEHLLSARRSILIPYQYYRGPSLSADPVEDPEEAFRRLAIRRFMVRTKCADYAVAKLYLETAGWDEEGARRKWEEDERWERENPLNGKGAKGGRRQGGGERGLVGRLW